VYDRAGNQDRKGLLTDSVTADTHKITQQGNMIAHGAR
jgi:hypothetical protein